MAQDETPKDDIGDIEPLDNLVCDSCLELNLTQQVHIAKCANCDEPYCLHKTSHVDPARCIECCHDVTVTIDTIEKTQLFESHTTGKIFTRKRKARQIQISGQHWLFIQRSIPQLSDAEVEASIEYHRTFLELLVNERETRRIANFRRNTGKVFKFTPPSISTSTTTTTVVKKTKTIKAKKPGQDLASLMDLLKASGLTKEQIVAQIVGKK